MPEKPATEKPSVPPPARSAGSRAYAAGFLALAMPGAGHLLLRRPGRALTFSALVLGMIAVGVWLEGLLPATFSGSPLAVLQSLGALGSGLPYLVLRLGLGYAGDLRAAGSEYGTAFLVTAGVMNLLLVLDVWDIATGVKD